MSTPNLWTFDLNRQDWRARRPNIPPMTKADLAAHIAKQAAALAWLVEKHEARQSLTFGTLTDEQQATLDAKLKGAEARARITVGATIDAMEAAFARQFTSEPKPKKPKAKAGGIKAKK